MENSRRDFLRKSLKIGAATTAVGVGASTLMAKDKGPQTLMSGVVEGKSPKQEALYYKSEAWEKYYKVVY